MKLQHLMREDQQFLAYLFQNLASELCGTELEGFLRKLVLKVEFDPTHFKIN